MWILWEIGKKLDGALMISVIIPVFNEEKSIASLIKYLTKYGKKAIEIIIVDGGSTDSTVEIVKKTGATIIHVSEKGRAKQMNAGAEQANNEILYFLHADTYPPKSFYDDIVQTTSQGVNSGCYRLAFDNKHPMLRFYAWFTRFDIDIFRFGDQSLFVTKEIFKQVKGFDERLIVMEDQEIVKSIKKIQKFHIFEKPVTTSARKYERIGFVKLQYIFTMVLLMYYLKIDQHKIVRYYFNKIS